MVTVSKKFETMKKAELYQNRLYSKYNYVRMVKSPLLSESGVYTWEVK